MIECPGCNSLIENLQKVCENCGTGIEWERKFKGHNPFLSDLYVLKGKGLKKFKGVI